MSAERMKILTTIVDRGDGFELTRLYRRSEVKLHMQIAANGTASSELLNTLGLTHNERDLLMSIAPESCVDALLSKLDEYRGILSVKGLAFTIDMTAASGAMAIALAATPPENEGGYIMHNEKEFNLVFAAVNQGYTDEVMHTACEAGATGGTVVRGRWVGRHHLEHFHGITLQDEKELLLIVCARDKRNAIMDAITKEHGLSTEQQALVWSVPIDNLVRLS